MSTYLSERPHQGLDTGTPCSIARHGEGKSESLNIELCRHYRLRELNTYTKICTKAASFVLVSVCFGSTIIAQAVFIAM